MSSKKPFAARLLAWHAKHGRHDLPWQHPRTPYRVWLAEVMLQQTQVATVIPYYARFLQRFPDVRALAEASPDDVLALWSGLGYYARGRNLHRAARLVCERHGGEFPRDFEAMHALPGVGRSTAGAILAQAFGERHPILEGNAKRVFARHEGIRGWPGSPAVAARLWQAAEARLPRRQLADYTQAVMDLGATLCTARAPRCGECPVAADCIARQRGLVATIPAPKPRAARPQRRAHLLLIENARGELLLERRPDAGIWGGLWCPPLVTTARWQTGAPARSTVLARLPPVAHAFSHYDLELRPLHLRGAVREPGPARQWVALADAARRGLPAPVRKILASLTSTDS